MFGSNNNNNNNNIINNIYTASPTSWHPIQTSSSYDLWELPTPSRSMTVEEEDRIESEARSSAPSSEPFLFDFENQFLAPLLSSWSFSSPRHDPTTHRPRLGSMSSVNSHLSVRTTQSQGERSLASAAATKKTALGDATNTAPVLRLPRSRFL